MAEIQWLVMAAVAIVAVIATIYFGIQNLRNVITQRERDSGYASGRIEAKLENLEQLWRTTDDDMRLVKEKLDATNVLIRQLGREAKKQSRRASALKRWSPTQQCPPRGLPPEQLLDSDAAVGSGR